MPIEIKELIIKASVRDNADDVRTEVKALGQADGTKDEQLIARCVEQVMEILRMRNER